MFHGVLVHFICILLPLLYWTTCPFIVWNSSDPKDKFSFDAFIMNNKVLSYCIHALVGNKWLQYGLDMAVPLLFGVISGFADESCSCVLKFCNLSVRYWGQMSTVAIIQPGENESPDKTDSQTHLCFTLTQISHLLEWNMRLQKVLNTQGVFS